MTKAFAPFGDARWKIAGGNAILSREMYFATYQAIAADANRPGLYREYPADFFDAIVIDECHRGSSRQDSNWREILNYYSTASQIGMTATPSRQDNADTYEYFGDLLDLICHLAFNAPLRTRRERAQRLRSDQPNFFEQYGAEARQILEDLLDKYTEHGTAQFVIPDILELPPINAHGNVIEIAERFGGVESLRNAVMQLQTLLYAAA